MHANNVSGAIFPIKDIFKVAKKLGVITLLDGAQSIGIVDVNIKDDFIGIFCVQAVTKGFLAYKELEFWL